MPDPFELYATSLTSPLIGGFPMSPSDTLALPYVTRQIRVTGAGGAIAVIWADGAETIEPVSSGDVLDWRLKQVKATGTTAAGLRGYY